jgi:cytochrome c-type biogenesis protein
MLESPADSVFLVQLVIAFGAGIISFISPCVLPLLPGYLSMMSGYSASQLEAGEGSAGRLTRVMLLFVLGFTLVFAAIGATASTVGQFLAHNLGTFTRIAGALIVAFGVLMVAMAVTNGGILAGFNQERRIHVRPSRLGRWAPPVMGAAFAFGWTPCIGPVLAVIIATASTQGTVGRGVALLVSYSLGLGVPFLLAGLGLFKFFGRLKPYLKPVNIASGALLALFGLVMVTGQLDLIAAWLSGFFLDVPFLRDLATV